MADTEQKQQVDPEAKRWCDSITAYEREFKKWEQRAEKITKKYRDYDSTQGSSRSVSTSEYNILWSNIQVLLPAVFARLPKPDVSRRFRDKDPVGRVASTLLERALEFEVEHYPDYRAAMEQCVLDRFLGGRGQAWVRYEPHFVDMPSQGAGQITEDQDEAATEVEQDFDYECAPVDYVHWKDFGHTVARTWEEVTGVWRRVYMDRAALVKRFGEEVGSRIPLDTKPPTTANSVNSTAQTEVGHHQACIYEIWDKTSNSVMWMSRSLVQILESRPDPLKLANFWPCPRPLYSTITNETLIPVPDFKYYQDQASQLTKLQTKIDGLIEMLQVKGVYDAAVPELARLFKEAGNGNLIAVKNWNAFSEKMGLKGSIDVFDITPIVAALNVAYDQVEKIKSQIYELMGISDIIRGASDPNETYGAQKLKGQYGNMRLRNQQARVTQFATELLQIKAQIICQHFQPQSFLQISAADQLDPTDQQIVPQALELLMGPRVMDPTAEGVENPLAGFRVEVSSDSMIQMDEAQDKAERSEFLTAVGGYLQQALPIIQQAPQAAPIVVGLLKFGVTGFKIGKTVEGMIDNTLDQMMQQASQPQPEKPDPEMAKIEAQMALEDKKLANTKEIKAFEAQADAEVATNEQRVQAEQNAHQNELEAQRAQMQAELDARLEQQRMVFEERISAQEQASAERMNQLSNDVKLIIAQMQQETAKVAAENKSNPAGSAE